LNKQTKFYVEARRNHRVKQKRGGHTQSWVKGQGFTGDQTPWWSWGRGNPLGECDRKLKWFRV